MLNLRLVGKRMAQTARLMVGVPDYANYLAHMRDHHPDHPVLSEAAFHRAAIEARYPGRSGKISKCPC
ncbi:YbdD/YjiX family protein [Laribacter hongkongensis]|uniref:DUF466 domain containing protein n=2 Tax=Laribacter hongkongensis TaxID=168471 RepID=C1DD35_LARHH|nr:YbdD/YjiX family protein [Laribacter hongkongensis]MBP8813379.1 YbdD/YjiX family protein [Laribacter sp.]ACO73670.1 DUF466 domain containing protein [Laribacter hongkongensis HLHK9]ASJ23500.1 hypothetical protein LHGZ1_0669 [Laribacter hongkongensis]MBE5530022.1 hypothetical protein [Laribacter hongkongensis]MBP9528979.1 YbdD/YjiX family protein [Laribacter sp.]